MIYPKDLPDKSPWHKILVDVYEPDEIWEEMLSEKLVWPERKQLAFGDYWMWTGKGELVSVERKHRDLGDMWPSRLHTQLMKAKGDGICHVVLLVEDILPHNATGRLRSGGILRKTTYEQVWTTLLRWQREHGIFVYQCLPGEVAVTRALKSIQGMYRRG